MPRMRINRTRTLSGRWQYPASAALLLLLAVPLPDVTAQGEEPTDQPAAPQSAEPDAGPSDVYFADSGRERTPAITAFPKYPSIARRDRVEGEATVCFTVNAQGQVIRPGIRSSSHKVFERPALSAIRASTFEPLRPGETKSNLKTCRIYRFKLAPVEVQDGDP